jgi:trigger factor
MEHSASEPQEMSNNLVTFTIEKKPACKVEFSVKASKELVNQARAKALKSLAKEVTLPGFRKGKAPDALILKNFPKEFDKKWQETIADLSLTECDKLAKIPRLARDTRVVFNPKSHSEQGAELTLTFEVEPQVPSVDPKLFSPTEVEKPEVNDEKVEETIRQVRFFFANWQKIENRPVQEGDFVILNVDIIDGSPEESLFKETRFEVHPKYMAEWMRGLVLGKNVGDEVEGISKVDEDAKNKEDFKERKVRITIIDNQTATLPDLDEVFLKKVGVQSHDELRENIKKLLEKQANDHVKEKLHEQVNQFLMEKYPFDLPPSIIDKESNFRMRQLAADANFQTYWSSLTQEDRKKMLDSIFNQSQKAVRMFYLCRKIISDANISVGPQDLPKPATTPLEFLLDPSQMLHFHENTEVKQAEALSKLILEKAAEHIISNCSN